MCFTVIKCVCVLSMQEGLYLSERETCYKFKLSSCDLYSQRQRDGTLLQTLLYDACAAV